MEYNTQLDKLRFREYGRNVQKIVQYALTISDKEKRTKIIENLVQLVVQMNSQIKNMDDFRHKLWDHIHIIANFNLDVHSPFAPPTTAEVVPKTTTHLPYPKSAIHYKHYGKSIEKLIDKALQEPKKEKQIAFAKAIGNYMKTVNKNANRDGVADDDIKDDLLLLSNGNLNLSEEGNFDIPKSNNNPNKNKNKKWGKMKDKKNFNTNTTNTNTNNSTNNKPYNKTKNF